MITEQTIVRQIEENEYKLLGQVEISDEDYDVLLNHTKNRAKYAFVQTIIKPDLLLSVAMVQIAIRHYKDGRYWPCFIEELGIDDVSGSKLNYLGQIFSKTLKAFNLFELKKEDEKSSKMYVENIKAHAFVTNYYMDGFYEFSYSFFENNLFRELSDDIDEDIEDLSEFMSTTLNSNKDAVSLDNTLRKTVKSYRLLKSTRTVFAQCDTNTVRKIFLPILSLFDKYYYDNEVPSNAQNRFEYGFIEWCKKQQAADADRIRKHRGTRKLYNHKPFIKISINSETVLLVIPQQKFRNNDCSGEAVVKVTIGGYTEERKLDLYRSFGIYISEEIRIPILNAFDEINIVVETESEKQYQIKKSNYRILNESYENISKFSIGNNYLLVEPKTEVTWRDSNDIIDTYTYQSWQYFSVNIREESICYVGNRPLSIIGEFSVEPIYEKLVNHFSVFDTNDKEVTITRTHPSISFVIDRLKWEGTVVLINRKKYRINEIRGVNCYEWPEDDSKIAFNIILDTFLGKEDGIYCIVLDVPGETNKMLCKYLFLRKFNCKFNKPRYTYDKEAIITFEKDGKQVYPINEEYIYTYDYEDEEIVRYVIPLSANLKEIKFSLYLDERNYIFKMPLRIFLYGFSQNDMRLDRPNYIWYSELREILYVRIPGAKSVRAFWDKEAFNKSYGMEIAPETFRIDISEFVRRISNEKKRKWQYINIEYEDNAIRRIALPAILRNMIVEPYFELAYMDKVVCMEVEVKGDAELFVDIEDTKTKEKIVVHRKVNSGKIEFPELKTNTAYDFYPVMEESDEFGFDVYKTSMKPIGNCVCLDSIDLVDCRLPVKKIFYNDEEKEVSFDYFITVQEKIDDITYEGYMHGYKLSSDCSKGRYILDKEGKRKKIKLGKIKFEVLSANGELELAVLFYSYADEEWMFPYYDSNPHSKYLVKPDSPILNNTSREYRKRLIELDDEMAVFEINVQKIRRYVHVI